MLRNSHSVNNSFYNSTITLSLFVVIVFNSTMLRFIWSIEAYSRAVNIVLLAGLILYVTLDLIRSKYPVKIMYEIVLPSILIAFGVSLNILICSFSDPSLLGGLGEVLPWYLLIMIPALYRKKIIDVIKLWKYSYYFMIVAVSLGLLDYVLIYINGGSATILKTSYGTFLGGKFSVLHMLKDGSPHFRFYSCFGEPGSLAMLLLPFIAYATYKKRIIGLGILVIGFILTNSLGGYISGLMMLLIMTYLSASKNKFLVIGFLIISPFLVYNTTYDYFVKSYEARNQRSSSLESSSASTRVENFQDGIERIPLLFFTNPLGIRLSSTTKDSMKNKDYVGSNFLPIYYLQKGGIMAFFGYILILYVSIKISVQILRRYRKHDIEYKVVAISLIISIPFLVQRTTIWETGLFGFLYAPIIMDCLRVRSKKDAIKSNFF